MGNWRDNNKLLNEAQALLFPKMRARRGEIARPSVVQTRSLKDHYEELSTAQQKAFENYLASMAAVHALGSRKTRTGKSYSTKRYQTAAAKHKSKIPRALLKMADELAKQAALETSKVQGSTGAIATLAQRAALSALSTVVNPPKAAPKPVSLQPPSASNLAKAQQLVGEALAERGKRVQFDDKNGRAIVIRYAKSADTGTVVIKDTNAVDKAQYEQRIVSTASPGAMTTVVASYLQNGTHREGVLPMVPGPSQESGEREFRYGVPLRPIGFATVPPGYIRVDEHKDFRHGVVVYPKRLSEKDVQSFELVYLPTDADIKAYLKRIVPQMTEYAEDTLELYHDERRFFDSMLGNVIEREAKDAHLSKEQRATIEKVVVRALQKAVR